MSERPKMAEAQPTQPNAAELAEKQLEERFKAIVTQDLTTAQGSRWVMIIVVVVIVTIIVGAAWYYMKRGKSESKSKPRKTGRSKGVKILNE